MNACESNCFFSLDTVLRAIFGAFAGAVIVTLIGCFIDGTLAFTTGGVTCAVTVTAGVIGGWIVGAVIGVIVATILSYLACKEDCAGAVVGVVDPGAAESGLTSSPAQPISCDDANRMLKLANDNLSKLKTVCSITDPNASTTVKTARHTATAVHFAIALGAAGLVWSAPLLLFSLILLPTTGILYNFYRSKAATQLAQINRCIVFLDLAQRRQEEAQKLVDELCGRSVAS